MIKDIINDEMFLAMKSADAAIEDIKIGEDLLDTLKSHQNECVGMAANMIGVNKRIIAFETENGYMIMYNPIIIKKSESYETEEGCLSLKGKRKCKRYRNIKVQYQNEKMEIRFKSFKDWTAEIIQHEIDHCDGIII